VREVGVAFRGAQQYIAPAAAITAVGPAPGRVLFAPEAEAAVAPVPSAHVNGHSVNEHGLSISECGGSSKDETGVGEIIRFPLEVHIDLDGLANRSPIDVRHPDAFFVRVLNFPVSLELFIVEGDL